MNTESELVRSAKVARAAATALGSSEPVESLLERLTVTVPPNSQVLAISYADRTAELAQRGTRAIAEAYLGSRQADVQADVERLTGALRKDLEFAEEQLRLSTDRAGSSLPSNSPDRVYAEAQRDILSSQITNLKSRLTTLTASTDRTGVIITDPVLPTRASFPVPALDLGVGLLFGLLLGAALALLVDRLDHRVRHGSDVVRRLGVPVLADVSRRAPEPGVFDRLRVTLDGRAQAAAPVQVADLSGSGASGTVALELASSWARVNGATTLVIAHPGTRLTGDLALQDRLGLSDLLQGAADAEHVQHASPAYPGLLVVPPGRSPEALDALLQSPAAAAALSTIGRAATVVVLETSGVGESVAAQALAAGSATTVLAVPVGTDERRVARDVQGVQQVSGDVAGVVLVRSPGSARAASTAAPAEGLPAAVPGTEGWADGSHDNGHTPATGRSVTARRPVR